LTIELPMKKLVLLLSLMLFALAACNGPSDNPVVVEVPTSTVQPVPSQTVRVTATIRPTNTPLPTFTYTPTLTLVPPTQTDTLTPSVTPTVGGIISAVQAINLRSGPGTEYDIIDALDAGTGVEVITQSPDYEWLNVRLQDGTEGWISAQFVRIEPTPTLIPSMTPSPDLTALFLGTPLAPTSLVGGNRATATPPNQVRTGTPEEDATTPPIRTEGALAGVPTIDSNSIYLTATALAGGLVNPTRQATVAGQSTNDRTITVVPANFTPPANATVATPLPQPTATLGTGRRVRVFAYCDSPNYGSDLTTVPVLRAGDTVVLWWGWIASKEEEINNHLEASNLELAVNGDIVEGANDMHGATQPFGGQFIVYWEVPIGPLTSGDYVISYQVTWDRAIYDGSRFYGPETDHPFEQESCSFTVP
jgi:uncharacterized protein YgiM (DUF1202 family)